MRPRQWFTRLREWFIPLWRLTPATFGPTAITTPTEFGSMAFGDPATDTAAIIMVVTGVGFTADEGSTVGMGSGAVTGSGAVEDTAKADAFQSGLPVKFTGWPFP